MRQPKCPLCGFWKFESFETIRDAGVRADYLNCAKCGLVSQWPRMTALELDAAHIHRYRKNQHVDEIEEYEESRLPVQYQAILLPYIRPGPRHALDFGCGTGEFLSFIKDGWPLIQTWGVEINPNLARRAHAKGHTIMRDLSPLEIGMRFDIIVLSHTLEHIPDPGVLLYNLRNRLTDSGVMYVEVPNLFGDIALELVHVFAFTESTLRTLLELSGLKIEHFETHGHPKSDTVPAYLSAVVSRKHGFGANQMPSPDGIIRKRRLGLLKRMLTIATHGGGERC